jgi:hypothetical protein
VPHFPRRKILPFKALCLLTAGCVLLAGLVGSASAQTSTTSREMPDVLVLVLSGVAPVDQVSINYSTEVPESAAKADISALAKETAWLVASERVTTRTVRDSKTTSASFNTVAVVNYSEGVLNTAPFINVLRRFPSIEINYLVSDSFKFRGLKDFENEFVNVHLDRRGSSYLYRIRVKDSSFDKLVLPQRQPERKEEQVGCLGGGGRVACAVIVALVCGLAAYVGARAMYRRGRGR